MAGVARMALMLFMPWYLNYIIDEVATPYQTGALGADVAWSRFWWVTSILGGIMVIHCAASLGRSYFPWRAAASAVRDLRFQLFRHLQRLSLGFHTKRPTGGIVARLIADVEAAQQVFDVVRSSSFRSRFCVAW